MRKAMLEPSLTKVHKCQRRFVFLNIIECAVHCVPILSLSTFQVGLGTRFVASDPLMSPKPLINVRVIYCKLFKPVPGENHRGLTKQKERKRRLMSQVLRDNEVELAQPYLGKFQELPSVYIVQNYIKDNIWHLHSLSACNYTQVKTHSLFLPVDKLEHG